MVVLVLEKLGIEFTANDGQLGTSVRSRGRDSLETGGHVEIQIGPGEGVVWHSMISMMVHGFFEIE